MKTNLFETAVGAVVIAAAVAFLIFAYSRSDFGADKGYPLVAEFGRIDGVELGADVRMAGVKIGSVGEPEINPQTYQARVQINITTDVPIPEDSAAKISFDGLLGGSYVAIEPGGSEDMLAAGDRIMFTQGAVDIIGVATKAFLNKDDAGAAE